MSHVRSLLYHWVQDLCVGVSSQTCCCPLCYDFTGLLRPTLRERKQQVFLFFVFVILQNISVHDCLHVRQKKKQKKQCLMVLSAGSGGLVALERNFLSLGGVGLWSVPLSFFHLSYTHVVRSDWDNRVEKQRSGIYFEYLFIYFWFLQFSSSWAVFDPLLFSIVRSSKYCVAVWDTVRINLVTVLKGIQFACCKVFYCLSLCQDKIHASAEQNSTGKQLNHKSHGVFRVKYSHKKKLLMFLSCHFFMFFFFIVNKVLLCLVHSAAFFLQGQRSLNNHNPVGKHGHPTEKTAVQ